VQYSGGASLGVWLVAVALLGVLAWAVMRSKAPAPEMGGAAVAATGNAQVASVAKPPIKSGGGNSKVKSKKR